MIREELQNKIKENLEEKERNVYDKDIVDEKVANDEIEPEEEAFMRGYLSELGA